MFSASYNWTWIKKKKLLPGMLSALSTKSQTIREKQPILDKLVKNWHD